MKRSGRTSSTLADTAVPVLVGVAVGVLSIAAASFPSSPISSPFPSSRADRPTSDVALSLGGLDRFLPLPVPEPTPDDARRTADDILAGREYQEVDDRSVLERVQTWVQTQFGRLLEQIFSGGGGAIATWLLVGLILAGLGYFVTRILRTVRPDPGVRLAEVVEVRRRPDEWRRDAEGHERAGEWKEALRCRFRALVGELVDVGTLNDVPGRTAGEYRREVRAAAPALAPGFAEATEIFERAWYGDEPTGPVENERFRALSDRVVAEAGR